MGAQHEENLSKNKLSEIGQVGGCLTLIWKMSLNSHFFFTLPLTQNRVNILAVKTDAWKITATQMFVELSSKLLLTEIAM